MDTISIVKKIMTEFADSTGLSKFEKSPRRYLWTDAFAVCNFLELYRQTGNEQWRQSALQLVNQVHYTLGRHREDDSRTGWISGLTEEDGKQHPTIGGLRIGKQINERKPSDPYDEHMEWDRDGQYYHYLTKWMHALNRVSGLTKNPIFNFWAIELAKTAHAAFVYSLQSGLKRMYWKMSIDLSYPLVPSMGQHDPLDGLITYNQLRTTALKIFKITNPGLDSEIADMEALCKGRNWVTEDPLGIGGILGDSYKILQLIIMGSFSETALLNNLLESSLAGLGVYMGNHLSELPADYRLAFRELGMSIGLNAVEKIKELLIESPDVFPANHPSHLQINRLERYVPLGETIKKFWLEPKNRKFLSWTEHNDINSVMLATSLSPDSFLEL